MDFYNSAHKLLLFISVCYRLASCSIVTSSNIALLFVFNMNNPIISNSENV